MITATIRTSTGAFLAPPQSSHDARPAGPWDANPRAALRGADVRAALADEVPSREAREAATVARMNVAHPGASWHFVTHPSTSRRVLVSVPHDDDDAPARRPFAISASTSTEAGGDRDEVSDDWRERGRHAWQRSGQVVDTRPATMGSEQAVEVLVEHRPDDPAPKWYRLEPGEFTNEGQ